MLDMVRYLVVWNPVILTALHFAFHLVGLDHGAEGGTAAHNSTMLANATAGGNITQPISTL